MSSPCPPPYDDVLDVLDGTTKIAEEVCKILEDMPVDLGMSSLINASVQLTTSQCDTIAEVVFYKNVFIKMFDYEIKRLEKAE